MHDGHVLPAASEYVLLWASAGPERSEFPSTWLERYATHWSHVAL